jgi:Tfp pilus assembly protein PilN
MIQFNLLPDVKLEYIKARRTKQTVVLLATLMAGGALAVFVLLFLVVNVAQKKHLRDLNRDIQTYSTQLENTPDLNKILTIQNQLDSLPALHAQKPVTSRLFGFLTQTTPAKVTISKLSVNFTDNTIIVNGSADAISTVNQYVDTLKFTTYATADAAKQGKAFTNVVLANFSRADKTTTYQVTFAFDPVIFEGASDITLTVPKIITTRSETEKPEALFQTVPSTSQGGQ